MTYLPLSQEPPKLFRGLIATSLAVTALAAAIGTAVYTWPGKTANARPSPHPPQARIVIQDDLVNEGFSWGWPAHLVDAAHMFQCGPAGANKPGDAVVLWTNGANSVLAFAAAREGAPLPAYASVLRGKGAHDASLLIQVADRRHVVQTSADGHVLRLEGRELSCIATWDD
jgi:hypothetical protein